MYVFFNDDSNNFAPGADQKSKSSVEAAGLLEVLPTGKCNKILLAENESFSISPNSMYDQGNNEFVALGYNSRSTGYALGRVRITLP